METFFKLTVICIFVSWIELIDSVNNNYETICKYNLMFNSFISFFSNMKIELFFMIYLGGVEHKCQGEYCCYVDIIIIYYPAHAHAQQGVKRLVSFIYICVQKILK